MKYSPEVKLCKAFDFFELFEHTHGDEQASDPKEGVHCKVCSRSECGNSWSGQDVQALSPVFDVGESKPLIVTVDDPEDGKNPSSIKKQ